MAENILKEKTSKQLISDCRNLIWDTKKCQTTIESGKLNLKECLYLWEKTDWNPEVYKSIKQKSFMIANDWMSACEKSCWDTNVLKFALESNLLGANDWLLLCEKSIWDKGVCDFAVRSKKLKSEKVLFVCENSNWDSEVCESAAKYGHLTKKQWRSTCKKSGWDWCACRGAVMSGTLNPSEMIEFCKKSGWDWDVCNAAIQTGILGRQELIKMLKNKQNINVVYALQSVGCSYQDIQKYLSDDLKFAVKKSLLFLTSEQIREKISGTGLYDTSNPNYFIAFKGVKENRQSVYAKNNPYYNYQDGRDYRAFANCDPFEQNSYGLSVWNHESAYNYESETVLRVRVLYSSVAAIVHKNNKIRVRNMNVMNEDNREQEYVENMISKKSEIRARINWYRENKNQKII